MAANSSPASFLQSQAWGEFQKSLGLKIYRLAVVGDDGELQASAQAIVRPLNLGRAYLEVPKGPIGNFDKAAGALLLDELKKIAVAEKAILIRVNPPYENNFQFSIFNFQKPELLLKQREPEDTVLVDLSHSEENLLAHMHEKSRYNIRLAMKKGVQVHEKIKDEKAFEKFLELIEQPSKRDGITVWPRARFEKFRQQFMLGSYAPQDPQAILLTGEFEGQTLAAAIVMLFGDSGTYLYAASSEQQRNANVPSLVLWEAIRQSKIRGKKFYDMWGISPAGAGDDHSWSGITRFKSRYATIGQTGVEKHYTGTWDLVLDKKYYSLFKIGKAIRSLIPK